MHKKIALLIQKIVMESPYDFMECEVIPKKTDGFWKCILKFTCRDNAHSTSLIEALHPIGLVYGEGLNIVDLGNRVEVD